MAFKYVTITYPESEYFNQVLGVQEIRPNGVYAMDIFFPIGHFIWH
jgi:hypothetical protein